MADAMYKASGFQSLDVTSIVGTARAPIDEIVEERTSPKGGAAPTEHGDL